MTEKRARRTFSDEQKKQLVELFNHGKPRSEIIREYDLTVSAFDKRTRASMLQVSVARKTAEPFKSKS